MKKMLVFLLPIGILFFVFSINCQNKDPNVPPLPSFVEGHVMEVGTTNPVDSVKIYFESTDITTFTDQTGYYVILAGWGIDTIYAEKTGYVTSSIEVDVIYHDTITANFELQKE